MILNINKPLNWTSFDVVAKVRGILKTKKVGHAGTLDPLATGVLIVLTDQDTKKQDSLMHTQKVYEARILFGVESPTYDMEGDLQLIKPNLRLNLQALESLAKKYTGEISQTVPPYSAVKVDGERLYKLARANKTDQSKLSVKQVEIFDIKILGLEEVSLEVNGSKVTQPSLRCIVTCSSGTYIRSLAHDLGQDLGTGAVLYSLVRTKVGDFDIKDSVTLEELAVSQS